VRGDAYSKGVGWTAAAAALAGLILLVSLFLPWAQIVCELEPCEFQSGWGVAQVLDIPIAVLALAAIALAALLIARAAPPPALALALTGLVALVLVLLVPILEDRGPQPVDFGGSWFLAVLGSLGVLAAGLTAFALVWTSSDDGDGEGGEDADGDDAG
jgi:drug/metabolite transporter (DMT)-like permease